MAARKKTSSPQQAKHPKSVAAAKADTTTKAVADTAAVSTTSNALAEAHLPPLGLVGATLLCSGFLFVLALRDFFTTGRNLLGDIDEAFLVS